MDFGTGDGLTREELAWELVELFEELDIEQINEMLAKNIPLETLDFFSKYTAEFSEGVDIDVETQRRLPNLMLIGYLLRVLEERLLEEPERFDA